MIKNIFITQKFSTGQKGQSLVELALTITILLTLLAGAFDLGNAFLDYIAMRDAAQEGAVYGSLDPNSTNIGIRVLESSNTPVNFGEKISGSYVFQVTETTDVLSCPTTDKTVCVTFTASNKKCTGNPVTVTVRYDYHLVMPFIGGIIGRQTIPLHARVTNEILTTACP